MYELIYNFSNLAIIPFWLVHLLSPYSKWSLFLARWKWGPLGLALAYFTLVLPEIPAILDAMANPDFHYIRTLLGQPFGATIAWLHILAFDLFVFEVFLMKPEEQRLPSWHMRSIGLFSLMVGPIGFVLFWFSTVYKKR